ncbi:MAG: adenylosuccinate lyase [Bacteroidetes bacterium]|nr:adenylosuccinate lyase [Bacteroidota bacterium]
MELNTLTALSSVDGRYHSQVHQLDEFFSEFGLHKYRVRIEIEYLLALEQKKLFSLTAPVRRNLKKLIDEFSLADAEAIKSIEKITNHDVKAVEYFIKNKLQEWGAESCVEWVHFGLTSQDINNTAMPLAWKHAMEYDYLPCLLNLKNELSLLAKKWSEIPMLARTHGQPASPTKLGKEIAVFVERLQGQIEQFIGIPFTGKFGGATGNFNAHHVAFPAINWIKFGNEFLNNLGLVRQQHTTQIEHYDQLAAQLDTLKRINTILIDFCRDMWAYVSLEYFFQKTKKGEVGSSAMPHKVNPIDFENAEGNLGVANALLSHLADKLPISRLQRDLTDSTVLRNLGVPVAHTLISFRSIEKGLNKLLLNDSKIYADLDSNWAVVAEAIQTILRREKYPNPYEALKELTRGKQKIDQKTLHQFIDKLAVTAAVKKELKKITPHNYTGMQAPIPN